MCACVGVGRRCTRCAVLPESGDRPLSAPRDPREPGQGSAAGCGVGATCEFFLSCWMGGGLLDGQCGALLHGCCRRKPRTTAKMGELPPAASNEVLALPADLGPVNNDPRKTTLPHCNGPTELPSPRPRLGQTLGPASALPKSYEQDRRVALRRETGNEM